jgi:hypothetical protein
MKTDNLPTPIAQVVRRLATVGTDNSADTFLATSYVVEAAIKHLAILLRAGLWSKAAQPHAYRLGYAMVRADGLGTWEAAVRDMLQTPVAAYFPSDYRPLLQWLTQNRTRERDEAFREIAQSLVEVVRAADITDSVPGNPRSFRDLVTTFVVLRNKTRGHGAFGENFFATVNPHFAAAVLRFLDECPAFKWTWLHLLRRDKGTVRAVRLQGGTPTSLRDRESEAYHPALPGVYCQPTESENIYFVGEFLLADRECRQFMLPNGGFKQDGTAEFIDFATGSTDWRDAKAFLLPPSPLPTSETHGLDALDVCSNVFGNLPPLPSLYVHRPTLEGDLMERLTDRNHAIISLHGRGGVGKTYLALNAAHTIAQKTCPPFEHIVWFSARDIDLRPSGPIPVRQAVADLKSIAGRFGSSFNVDGSVDTFGAVLRDPKHLNLSTVGFLFIFDNFETMADKAELHKYLDTHTHLPNKVLITSRERSFKADFPVEVRGMEFSEAKQLMVDAARTLNIEPLLTEDVQHRIYDYSEGHAYVMRLLVGEMAKERRYVPPHSIVPRKDDVVQALFERSFSQLSETGRRIFLAVANWQSAVWEATLLVVFSQRGLDVESGIEECVRLSLLMPERDVANHAFYTAPQLARVFARRKLDGDPDRLLVMEDLEILKRFGPVCSRNASPKAFRPHADSFIAWCDRECDGAPSERIQNLDQMLEALATIMPELWLDLARFREKHQLASTSIADALRRAVEEQPFRKDAWLARADFARRTGDRDLHVACLVSAVDAGPLDVSLVREVAYQLCQYVDEHKTTIPRARRGVYLSSVRQHMERLVESLDATALSRLAWLFLLEGDEKKGWEYASLGNKREPSNSYCLRILERLEERT